MSLIKIFKCTDMERDVCLVPDDGAERSLCEWQAECNVLDSGDCKVCPLRDGETMDYYDAIEVFGDLDADEFRESTPEEEALEEERYQERLRKYKEVLRSCSATKVDLNEPEEENPIRYKDDKATADRKIDG